MEEVGEGGFDQGFHLCFIKRGGLFGGLGRVMGQGGGWIGLCLFWVLITLRVCLVCNLKYHKDLTCKF